MATAAAAAVAKARRDVVSHFLSQNAVSAENAVPYAPPRRLRRRFVEKFVAAGILHTTPNGSYWIDVPRWHAANRTRRRRIGAAVGIAAVVAGLVAAFA